MPCPTCNANNPPDARRCSACGVALNTIKSGGERLPNGTTLQHGAYKIDRVLGQGGFGITYLATDTQLGRAVAIKEFFPANCNREGKEVQPGGTMAPGDFETAKQRFLEESRTLARFRHPGIVNVFTAFEENNTAYMVMEYLLGQNLGALVQQRGGGLEQETAVSYIRATGEALETVHQAGLLHRDIKPENLMLGGDGRIVLIDFGTARDFAIGRTQGHTVVVTPGYAPLEQYAQRAQRGVYSDVYGLAATLYFMLTGVTPVAATDRAAGIALEAPAQISPSVDRHVSDAVRWAMELKVDARPQSVRVFLEALTTGATPAALPLVENAPTDPFQSAISAWQVSRHRTEELYPQPAPLDAVVADMWERRALRDLARDCEPRHDGHDTAIEAIPPVIIATSEARGMAKELKWPDQCACCGAGVDRTLSMKFSPPDRALKEPRIWNIPLCSACVRHIKREAPEFKPMTTAQALSLTAATTAFVGAFAEVTIIMPILGAVSAGVLLTYMRIERFVNTRVDINLSCRKQSWPLKCVDARLTSGGQVVYLFEFENAAFRERFAGLNANLVLPPPTP